jgi:hypothetical protein
MLNLYPPWGPVDPPEPELCPHGKDSDELCGNPIDPRFAIALQIKGLESKNLDLENTILALADPDDYETGGEKTAETCRRLAAECIERNGL